MSLPELQGKITELLEGHREVLLELCGGDDLEPRYLSNWSIVLELSPMNPDGSLDSAVGRFSAHGQSLSATLGLLHMGGQI